MEKYVSVETVRSIFRDWACCTEDVDEFMSDIDKVSTSDVAPVRRARWVSDGWKYSEFHCCSACGCLSFRVEDNFGYELSEILSNFCPDCGARMEGEA